VRSAVCVFLIVLDLAACGPDPSTVAPTNESNVTSPANLTPKQETSPMDTGVPKGILDPVLKEAAKLANVPQEQVAIARAEAVVWSDGSLGCPEPGMQYAQALVRGYWVVVNAAGQEYDFRAGNDGSFRLCPAGRGRPPSRSDDAT
jgi:hypothetical protein